jgi:anti-sigma-K factor RskA
MITDRQEELVSLHALGLLEGAEKSAFEAELTANGELRTLHDRLVEAAASVALSVAQTDPPAALKDRVLAACAKNEAGRPADLQHPGFSVTRFIPWAAAAVFLFSTVWLARQTVTLRDANANLQTERQLAEVAYRMAQSRLDERTMVAEKMINDLGKKLRRSEDLARLKITALASLAGNTKEAQVIAVWDPDQQAGLLASDKLPAIADTQDYQLWIVDPSRPNPVNGGVFHAAADGKVILPFWPDQPVTKATAFAISVERKGGVAKAEGPIVLLGQ